MYLDTNIFLRFLTNDHPDLSPRAYRLFKELELGTRTATTVALVIAEIVYVLASPKLYNLSRLTIETKLTAVIGLKGLQLSNKHVYMRALNLYANRHLDFVDAYLAALAEQTKIPIASFDERLAKVADITRIEL
jgi:predicted nucleic acid-binding protein